MIHPHGAFNVLPRHEPRQLSRTTLAFKVNTSEVLSFGFDPGSIVGCYGLFFAVTSKVLRCDDEVWLMKAERISDRAHVRRVEATPNRSASCDECWGTGFWRGFGGPCTKGCKP